MSVGSTSSVHNMVRESAVLMGCFAFGDGNIDIILLPTLLCYWLADLSTLTSPKITSKLSPLNADHIVVHVHIAIYASPDTAQDKLLRKQRGVWNCLISSTLQVSLPVTHPHDLLIPST